MKSAIRRRDFLKLLGAGAAAGLLPGRATLAAAKKSAGKPNVILCMCDDLGWGDVGYNKSSPCKTPALDALSKQGIRFDRWYSAAPVCSPTRGSCITGRHPYRYGIPFANKGHMKKEEVTLAEALKTQGYATGHFGKWHLGTLTTKIQDANRGKPGDSTNYSTPAMNGFDVYLSTESKVPTYDPLMVPKEFQPGQSRHYGWIPVEEEAQAEHYGTHYWDGEEHEVTENVRGDDSRVIVDRAVPFIRDAVKAGTPFLAVIWFHTPHLPVVADKAHRDMYKDLPVKEQLYYGCITAMDEQVARLHEELEKLGVRDNTMFWFSSDNGPENGTPGSAGPYRGRKRSLYEGGVRVPGMLVWPAKVTKPRAVTLPCCTSDYFPTVLEVLGFTMKGQPEPIDGVSLLPLIEGGMTERPRPIGFQSSGQLTLSDNRYKIVKVAGKRGKGAKDAGASAGSTFELYDLIEDPYEKTDIADKHPEVVEKMKATVTEWVRSCADSAAGRDYR